MWEDLGQKKILSLYKTNSPRAYQSSVELNKRIEKNGWSNPEQCRNMAEIIRSHIIRFGEKRHLHQAYINMWNSFYIN